MLIHKPEGRGVLYKALDRLGDAEAALARAREAVAVLRDLDAERPGAYGSILQPIQLKASYDGAKTYRANVHTGIAEKPGGCVIWLIFDPATLEIQSFLWFGAEPGTVMPSLGECVARHTRGDRLGRKGERAMIRVVKRSAFQELRSMQEVIRALFGTDLASKASN